jgi:hypothetical protein
MDLLHHQTVDGGPTIKWTWTTNCSETMGPKWPSPNIICITAVLIQINLHPFSWYCQFSCYTTEQEEEWSGRHTPWDMHTMWMQLLAPVVSLQNSMGACASIVHKLHSKNVECAFSSQAVTCSLELSKCCRLVFFFLAWSCLYFYYCNRNQIQILPLFYFFNGGSIWIATFLLWV